jgi:hypothetical protein
MTGHLYHNKNHLNNNPQSKNVTLGQPCYSLGARRRERHLPSMMQWQAWVFAKEMPTCGWNCEIRSPWWSWGWQRANMMKFHRAAFWNGSKGFTLAGTVAGGQHRPADSSSNLSASQCLRVIPFTGDLEGRLAPHSITAAAQECALLSSSACGGFDFRNPTPQTFSWESLCFHPSLLPDCSYLLLGKVGGSNLFLASCLS